MTPSTNHGSARVRLLDVDSDLARGLSETDWEHARRFAVAETVTLGRGVHDPGQVGTSDLLGLLVLKGLLIRSVEVAERSCGELVGAQELLRPWDHFGRAAPMPFEVRWRVVQPVTLAVLDHRFTLVSARWPALMHNLVCRAVERSHALAFNVAIHCLQHVRLRLVVLLWHLADRFGRVTQEGTVVPLKLSHGDLAELIGSQRPSVSASLSKLHDEGLVSRRNDRTWLLHGEPPAELRDMRARRPDDLTSGEDPDAAPAEEQPAKLRRRARI